VLVVNTASQCGLTPQYKGLEALYRKYKDKGLVVLGVPSNDFGRQEPGTETEIKTFCSTKYDVTFPMTAKYPVTGDGAHPLYKWVA
jgi:glutathione peroxidase